MAELPENDRIAGPFIAAAGQTDFPGDFPLIDAPGDPAGTCVVFVRERAGETTELVLGDFTIPAVADGGFTLRLVVPALAGDRCFVVGRQRQARLREHPAGGAVRTPTLEDDARELAARAQEARRDLARSPMVPVGEEAPAIAKIAFRAGKLAVFDDEGQFRWDRSLDGFDADVLAAELAKAQTQADAASTAADRVAAAQAAAAAVGLAAVALAEAVEMGPFTTMAGVPIPVVFNAIRTTGYAAAGDGGAAIYKRVESQPLTHLGRFQDALGAWWELAEQTVVPEMLGATGDGATDDVAALNATAAYAAVKGAAIEVPRYRTYCIAADNWLLLNGIKSVIGRGGVIKLTQASGTRSIVLKGQTSGAASNVFDLTVQGVTLDANGKATLGIYGQNCARCRIQYNTIMNNTNSTSTGVLLKAFANGGLDCTDNVVSKNLILGSIGATGEGSVGIAVGGEQATPYGGYADASAEWKATFNQSAAAYVASRNQISDNLISGHYYAIGLSLATYNLVAGNTCRNNVRGISLQARSTGNKVSDNLILENSSTAVHVAYMSNNNLIEGNICYSSRCDSYTEGLYQAYVGCVGNSFLNNKGVVTAGAGPAFYAYSAIHSYDNNWLGNVFSGPCRRAYMAVESAWDNTIANLAHRAQAIGSAVNDFANAQCREVEFYGNVITPTSAVPVFFLAQVSDGGASSPYALSFVSICGNRVRGTAYSKLIEILEETAGQCHSLTFAGNVHSATTAKVTLPRGRAHFTELRDRLFDGGTTETAFADGDTTPSVLFDKYFRTANTAPTSITDFDDGQDGQEIELRLDANTTIVHNSALIRNANPVNLVGTTNQFVRYRSIGGIWWQTK